VYDSYTVRHSCHSFFSHEAHVSDHAKPKLSGLTGVSITQVNGFRLETLLAECILWLLGLFSVRGDVGLIVGL